MVEQEIRQLIDQVVRETNEMLWRTGQVEPDASFMRVTPSFRGAQFAPWYEDESWTADAQGWREGNVEAGRSASGKGFYWTVDHLLVLPRTPDEAAVSYRVNHYAAPDRPPTQALFLETWVRIDGDWTLHRHHAEKARPITSG